MIRAIQINPKCHICFGRGTTAGVFGFFGPQACPQCPPPQERLIIPPAGNSSEKEHFSRMTPEQRAAFARRAK